VFAGARCRTIAKALVNLSLVRLKGNVKNPTNHRGAFVAFEGLDASGKSTQLRTLLDWLRTQAVPHEYISFPRTDEEGYGEAIAMFLRGEFGSVDEVHPYLVASLFAGDRATARPVIENWLNASKLVIADRYFYSNVAFQSAKIEDLSAKAKFQSWIRYVEFECNSIPRPDLTIFFDVPFDFIRENIVTRAGENRSYLNGQTDIHEAALELQEKVAEEYRKVASGDPTFHILSCVNPKGYMRSVESIRDEVIMLLTKAQVLRSEARQWR